MWVCFVLMSEKNLVKSFKKNHITDCRSFQQLWIAKQFIFFDSETEAKRVYALFKFYFLKGLFP